jgi:hypothetical protein
MTAKILDSFGGKFADKFAERWVTTIFTPAFIFYMGGLAVWIQRFKWPAKLIEEFTRYPDLVKIAALGAILFVITTLAFVVQKLDLVVIRFLEGYWPQWLWQLRTPHYRKLRAKLSNENQSLRGKESERRAELQRLRVAIDSQNIDSQGANSLSAEDRDRYLELKKSLLNESEQAKLIRVIQSLREMPILEVDPMPTRLGNLLRAAERQPLNKYGLDAVVCWSRLWMLLPEPVKKDLQEARTELNTAARIWLWSILFCGWSLLGQSWWTTWPIAVGLISAWCAYQWAIDAARNYGELIEASFDLYRHLLYQAMRWELPADPQEEHRVGGELTRYLLRRSAQP